MVRWYWIVVSPCWGYGFVTQTWLSDDAKEKLCRSNMTFISELSTTAWQVARWNRVETLISGLNPPGRSLSQFWYDSGDSVSQCILQLSFRSAKFPHGIEPLVGTPDQIFGTLGLLYSFPSVPCVFLMAGVLENKLQVPSYAICYGVWLRIVTTDMTRRHHTWLLSGRFS
jgi:hypothetical protein